MIDRSFLGFNDFIWGICTINGSGREKDLYVPLG